jgi:Cu/Ag efflux protein CusF
MRRSILFVCLVTLAAVSALNGQVQTSVGKTSIVTVTAVIAAIDSTNRLVTLKRDDGISEIVFAGPEVQRFSELKVGDKVTFKFQESIVYDIQQPGAKPPSPEKIAMERAGAKPGGKITQTVTAVVTLTAIDMAIPSVTIKTEKGEVMSFKVEDKTNLNGVKVGDKVQITYTRALAISVESPKK